MKQLVLIFLGGGLGSVMRYAVSNATKNLWSAGSFPAGTFVVNILGCFLMGIFISLFLKNDSPFKWFLMTGFCGGFTTFSAFSAESVSLFQSGQYAVLGAYVLLSLLLGFLALALGLWVFQR